MGRSFRTWPLGAALLLCLAADSRAQYFGRNKVQYDRDDVRVLATEHFDIYYSAEYAPAAVTAGRLAERWYARLSKTLDHSLSGRQPIVLYSSHRTFEQTNVYGGLIDENTGGFTEPRKRRIVVPFSASLADTDHVLGHEIVHAFQFDMAARYKTGVDLPLWFIEGMAEYLTLGPGDPMTAMWMRAAVRSEKLPTIRELASPRYFPYRWGAALWAYLVNRYGPDLPAKAMRMKRDVAKRLSQLTGERLGALSAAWHASLRDEYAAAAATNAESRQPLISASRGNGRLNLAASLSPDGRRLVFFSERDQFSIDLFLADASSGAVVRKLITTAANARFESLQYLHSAGAWDPSGRWFALATIRGGRPALTIVDVEGRSAPREIALPTVDEAYSPSWAPDGRSIVFSGLTGGFTDLFIADLATGALRQLTDDQYADLQPAWSPDGSTIAFTTDRFSTDLTRLRLGPYRIGLLDVGSRAITQMPAFGTASQWDPAWAPDRASIFFLSDLYGASNVFRMRLNDSAMYQVTGVQTGVSGVTRLSPALSVAAESGAIAFSVFRGNGYDIETLSSPAEIEGTPLTVEGDTSSVGQESDDGPIDPVRVPEVRDAQPSLFERKQYRPALSLEVIGSPYFSAGGGSFGSYVQGGASFLFGDMLGDRQLLTAINVNSHLSESAFGTVYLDRSSRWNWGTILEQSPEIRMLSTLVRIDPSREDALTRERERQIWTHRHIGGFLGYPLNRSQRVELSAGFREISFERELRTEVFSATTGRLLEERSVPTRGEPAIALAEVGAALVGDSAVFGATGPMLGTRYRFQVTPAIGTLSFTSVLADYRRYVMPIRPYTIALRMIHSGRYGGDADDVRLREVYVGSSSVVRGYGSGAVARSACRGSIGDCPMLNSLLGTSLLAAKLELRVPVMGALSSRVRYGALPMDAFAFADAGAAWGGHQHAFGPGGSDGIVIRSIGAGVRLNAVGMILELATVRPLDLKNAGWSFAFNLRPGF